MGYNHINECWNALYSAKNLKEIEKLFLDFPRWSGSWEYTLIYFKGESSVGVQVYNSYFDQNTDTFEDDHNTVIEISLQEAYDSGERVYDEFNCEVDLEEIMEVK